MHFQRKTVSRFVQHVRVFLSSPNTDPRPLTLGHTQNSMPNTLRQVWGVLLCFQGDVGSRRIDKRVEKRRFNQKALASGISSVAFALFDDVSSFYHCVCRQHQNTCRQQNSQLKGWPSTSNSTQIPRDMQRLCTAACKNLLLSLCSWERLGVSTTH